MKGFKHKFDMFSSFAQSSRQDKTYSSLYNNALRYKSFLLESTVQLAEKISPHDSAIYKTYLTFKYIHRRLAKEYAKPIAKRQNVEDLEIKANELEKELARKVGGFRNVVQQVEWKEVQQTLQPGEAAVEFIHYKFYTPDPTDSTFYAALVLRPGDKSPHFVPLFEEKELQVLLDQEYGEGKDYLAVLYAPPSKKAGTSLYELIWRPLDKILQKSHTLYTSPSGQLHRINLGAVMDRKKRSWNDRHKVIMLGSTRRLAFDTGKEKEQALTARIYGGVQYEMDSLAITQAIADFIDVRPRQNELSFSMTERSERGQSWYPLPGAEREAEKIAALIEQSGGTPSLLKGHEATEESFNQLGRNAPSPRILHLATHGYFYSDPDEEDRQAFNFDEKPAFKISDHPMIRSGLILAGGNQVWQGKPALTGAEDGVLTAYEVSQVNLRNTELVVLSACETGLGDIEGNEGVYGLQRAFKIAGAKNIIMSLWIVPDEQTQEMMTSFYRYWLEDENSIPDAFRKAQQAMRKRYKAHYYWAGFVLIE